MPIVGIQQDFVCGPNLMVQRVLPGPTLRNLPCTNREGQYSWTLKVNCALQHKKSPDPEIAVGRQLREPTRISPSFGRFFPLHFQFEGQCLWYTIAWNACRSHTDFSHMQCRRTGSGGTDPRSDEPLQLNRNRANRK